MSIVPPACVHVNTHATLIESFQTLLDHLEGSLRACGYRTRRYRELLSARNHLLRELAIAEAEQEANAEPVAFRPTATGVTVLCRDGREVHLPGRTEADMVAMGLERVAF